MAEGGCNSCTDASCQPSDVPFIGTSSVINGCVVNFPVTPYGVQEQYMSKIIKALNEGGVAALESPTGTGKTLSLLCSTLAWVEKNKMTNRMQQQREGSDESPDWPGTGLFKKVVFYASRTHSQLSKAMAEMRRTHYKHLKAAILGSRDQMCIHPDLPVDESLSIKPCIMGLFPQLSLQAFGQAKLQAELRKNPLYKAVKAIISTSKYQPVTIKGNGKLCFMNAFCQAHVNAKSCRFHLRTEAVKSDPSFHLVRDIEDLVVKSRKSGCCPFYMSRYLQEGADIIFLPYNYIFDRGISRKLNLNFNGAIVILDEAHNIDRVCEEAASFSLSSTDIAVAIRDITEDMQRIHDEFCDSNGDVVERSYSTEDLIFMKERLMALEAEFDEFMKTVKEKSKEFRPDALQVILSKAMISEETCGPLEAGLNSVHDVVEAHAAVNNRTRTQACTLRKVADFIGAPYHLKVFSPQNLNSFVVHTELDYPVSKRNHFGQPIFTPNSNEKPKGIIFNLWCLNPSLGMQALWNAHSVILTSGTLSPLKNVVLELGLKHFPSCLNGGAHVESAEFGHVVPSDQFMIFSIGKGPNGIQLQYNFQNKENLEYWEELGLTILNFIRLIPDGVLVFFPSYQALNKASNCWKFKGLWDRLSAIKPLFAEETDKRRFNNAIEGYRTSVTEGKGGVLMGICRGKMAEGIDFSDQYGRAVIVCGLPYPPYYDPRVKSKMRYIDSLKISDLKGQDWYRAEATKAVNQAIGRVIRHANDVGCILLCDTKFEQPMIASSVSAWLRPVSSMNNFGMAIAALRKFFRRHVNLSVRKEATPSPSKSAPSLPEPTFRKLGMPLLPSDFPSSSSSGLLIPLRIPEKTSKTCLASLDDADDGNDDLPRKLPPNSPIKSWRDVCPSIKEVTVVGPAKLKTDPKRGFIPKEITFEENTPELKERARRMNQVKFLLHELKRTLDDPSYEVIIKIFRFYQQDKDLNKFIDALTILFPKEDELLADFFRECHKFLSGPHKIAFIEHCNKNGYGVVLTCSPKIKLEEPPEF